MHQQTKLHAVMVTIMGDKRPIIGMRPGCAECQNDIVRRRQERSPHSGGILSPGLTDDGKNAPHQWRHIPQDGSLVNGQLPQRHTHGCRKLQDETPEQRRSRTLPGPCVTGLSGALILTEPGICGETPVKPIDLFTRHNDKPASIQTVSQKAHPVRHARQGAHGALDFKGHPLDTAWTGIGPAIFQQILDIKPHVSG